MEIYLDKRAVKQIRLSAQDAVDEGDHETLREDIMEAFTEEQVEEIERRLDSGDFYEFLTDVIEEWSGDDVDELFELIESQLSDVGIDLKYEPASRTVSLGREDEEEEEDFAAAEEDDDEDEDEDDDDADEDQDDEEDEA